ncbi:Calsyntenin-1 [Halotydeus destructor]|nr:Calsyntenin-1 [Halotydeus destructor]
MKLFVTVALLLVTISTNSVNGNSIKQKLLPSVATDVNSVKSSNHKACKVAWKEVHKRIEYTPGSGKRILYPDAELQLCDVDCDTENVTVHVALGTKHIGKGCDRDTYSVESQRKLCGASSESIDLLPSPGIGAEWTRDLPTDDGHESDQMFEFDGSSNAVVIPESTLEHNLTTKFSISFWMKHEAPADRTNKHIKEHILCNADDHKKNRHHYGLFVRNCRLILLLRREFNEEKHTVFRPAEWRWKMAETCDNEWHHYSVSINFPEVTLYIDGQRFKNTTNNPEVVDDWPLHYVNGINTTMVVGACWEGKASKMKFHFRGFLAGLAILRGRNENVDVLSCLRRCKEGLQLPPTDSLDPDTDVSINSDSTEITVQGKDSIDVEDILSQISYLNSREFPTPGRRNIRIMTSIKCSNRKALKIPVVDSHLMVLPADQPSIALNGTPNLAREYDAFMQGIELFSTVNVLVNHEPESNDDNLEATEVENSIVQNDGTAQSGPIDKLMSEHKLDTCTIQVYPPLNPEHEYFRLPLNYMEHLGVHFKETKDGIVIHGADTVHSYQSILREIVYFNRKPAYYLNRAFKLTCSELNGRFVSNDYIQTLTVIHPKATEAIRDRAIGAQKGEAPSGTTEIPVDHALGGAEGQQVLHVKEEAVVAHAQVHEHKAEMLEAKMKTSNFLDSGLVDSDTLARAPSMNSRLSPIVVGHAVTVIIVVCVGFLVFMIVLGVIRIRAAHHRSSNGRDDDQEMAWDDSSLTITVNPLDQIGQDPEQQPVLQDDDDDSDSSDDGSSYREDGESSEEEVEPIKAKLNKRELEWDDSNLDF